MMAWTQIEAAVSLSYLVFEGHPHRPHLRDQLGRRLQGEMKSRYTIGSYRLVSCKRIFTPTIPRTAFDLPLTAGELETRLEVDVVRNLNNAPGIACLAGGFQQFRCFQ